MYRPLPGAGGGSSGPAYDDSEIRDAIADFEAAIFRDAGSYVATPPGPGESDTLRYTVPLPAGTMRDLGLRETSQFTVSAGTVETTFSVSPDDTAGMLTQKLFMASKDPLGFSWHQGEPIRFSSEDGSQLTFTPTAAAKALGLATGGQTSQIPAFWQGGEILHVPVQYPSVTAALKAISQRFRVPGANIRVLVAPGVYNLAAPIDVSDIDLSWVSIDPDTSGGEAATWTGNAAVTVAGSAGAWTVTVPCSSEFAAACSVGDYVELTSQTLYDESNRPSMIGYWRVTAVGGSSVSLAVSARNTISSATITAAKLYRPLVRFDCDQQFITANRAKTPIFGRFGAVYLGTDGHTGIEIYDGTILRTLTLRDDEVFDEYGLCLNGFQNGVIAGGSFTVFAASAVVSNCAFRGFNIVSNAMTNSGAGCIATGCGNNGYYSSVSVETIMSSSPTQALLCVFAGNGRYGVQANRLSEFISQKIVARGNAWTDFIATAQSWGEIQIGGSAIGTISPAANTTGNNNSHIARA